MPSATMRAPSTTSARACARRHQDVERLVVHYFEPQRQLALAEAGLGNYDEAVRSSTVC